MTRKEINVENIEALQNLFGSIDENVGILENTLDVAITLDRDGLFITGAEENAKKAELVLASLLALAKKEHLTQQHIQMVTDLVKDGKEVDLASILSVVAVTAKGKQIRAKSLGQKVYVNAIKKNEIVFGIGPAGTGKTYLAVALAVMSYKNKEVEKIILTRPAVEAGEKLGFLPGDLQNKVDPYLRPLYDALSEMLGFETYQKLLERGVIEVAPLAYMRGRTLSNSFIILDEAQNTTREQMKMFLTRMGEGSKVVVTGDVTQIDLPSTVKSGLIHAVSILENIKGIDIVHLTYKDVVRHALVQNIIRAYEKEEKKA